MIENGRVVRPWIGIMGQNINSDMASLLKLPSDGILIAEVVKGSPADKAGIRGGNKIIRRGNFQIIIGGDMIVGINGKDIKSMDDMVEYIESKTVGDSVDVTIMRDGKTRTVKVYLSEMPSR